MKSVPPTLHLSPTARRLPEPSAVLELFKPVTWFPPMWAFACGAVSAGAGGGTQWTRVVWGMVVAGPLVCATSQAVNDWFDRHVDALNEPHRPIPSGRVPGRMGLYLAILWTAVSAAGAWFLGWWGFWATVVALVMAWGYSAPPFRFKQNGWVGNLAVGLSYESLAWITGAAVILHGALPRTEILVVAVLYGLGAHGIMTLNDFKSREGDLAMGIKSIPALLGPSGAAWSSAVTMLLAQAVVVALLVYWGAVTQAYIVSGLMLVQAFMLRRLLRTPDEGTALWYSSLGVPVYVAGMMVTAFAL